MNALNEINLLNSSWDISLKTINGNMLTLEESPKVRSIYPQGALNV